MDGNGRCPYCESDKVVKAGIVYLRNGPQQRYQCRNCYRHTTKPKRQLDLPLAKTVEDG